MQVHSKLAVVVLSILALAAVGCSKSTKAGPDAAASASARPAASFADLPAPPDVAAAPADAVKTASGLATKILQPGTGDKHPQPQDSVRVHYTGWTADGKMFDSSLRRGQPASFGVKGVIAGWTEALR